MAILKKCIPALIALLMPPGLVVLFFALAGRQREVYEDGAILLPIALGLIALNQYRMRGFIRIPVNLVYVAGMIVVDFLVGADYVCSVYHACL